MKPLNTTILFFGLLTFGQACDSEENPTPTSTFTTSTGPGAGGAGAGSPEGGNGANGGSGTGGDCTSEADCWDCAPTENVHFLNACTDASCNPFDNVARLPLYNGGDLPPLP